MASPVRPPHTLQGLRRLVVLSDHPLARVTRGLRKILIGFELPAPRLIVRPLLFLFLACRAMFYLFKKKFICEPLLKAYCTSYGKGLQSGVFIPWIQGAGDLIIGDDFTVYGKLSITYGTRFSERPTFRIGNNVMMGHLCSFTVAKSVTIGNNCLISAYALVIDSSGHPVDPVRRLAGWPPLPEEVRPVVIEDNVWIGTGCTILPGVTIGEGSVVSAGSVVRRNIPPYSLAGGNPARVLTPLPHAQPEAGPGVSALPEGTVGTNVS